MASATVLTLTKIEATSEVVTRPASTRVHALHEDRQRVEAVHVRVEVLRGHPDQRQDDAEREAERGGVERRAAGFSGAAWCDEIAWMMNCVEKMAPTVPMVQAKTVGKPILPSQVK